MMIKTVLCAFIFMLNYSANGAEDRECVYDDRGICLEDCPTDTFSYNPGCVENTMSQATCRNPQQRSIGVWCDYSRCDCHPPKVWDEVAERCVLLENCQDQSSLKEQPQSY